jgi:hypothetical protein
MIELMGEKNYPNKRFHFGTEDPVGLTARPSIVEGITIEMGQISPECYATENVTHAEVVTVLNRQYDKEPEESLDLYEATLSRDCWEKDGQ